eukprot:CAMPEP_0114350802 /NCGR_PEP_ID=MMETSP0101-20121206/16660_1 /TAXON_ID=38822 ORGANISM="Pteridomonas danica, Strain PT" /NCGR_SAMPLE_ID=MMETSP0101 /ASSEMBLY_ACC=CAM_ASM_000211 /LENGTH=88 /DNA_ID=CAMNT_0001490267 /DNA_START=177 /DNA_END=440 /DNA_ORIENTATION=+
MAPNSVVDAVGCSSLMDALTSLSQNIYEDNDRLGAFWSFLAFFNFLAFVNGADVDPAQIWPLFGSPHFPHTDTFRPEHFSSSSSSFFF